MALAWALHLDLDMSCGCFASSSDADPISGMTMLRDGGGLALALYVLIFDRGTGPSLDGWLSRARNSLSPPPAGV